MSLSTQAIVKIIFLPSQRTDFSSSGLLSHGGVQDIQVSLQHTTSVKQVRVFFVGFFVGVFLYLSLTLIREENLSQTPSATLTQTWTHSAVRAAEIRKRGHFSLHCGWEALLPSRKRGRKYPWRANTYYCYSIVHICESLDSHVRCKERNV